MPFPRPVPQTPRDRVDNVVRAMLREKDEDGEFYVGRVICVQEVDGTYTIIPKRQRNDLEEDD
jgi:hypothetical protein